ncbi:MAG: glycosyltransferase [Armatimonadota bacterium]
MRIVLATWGSFGDLHPFLAIGGALRDAGHAVVLATCPLYRAKVESEHLEFAPLRPDLPPPDEAAGTMARLMDGRKGPRNVLAGTVLPGLRQMTEDLEAACVGADRLVFHPIVLPAPHLATARGIRFACATLQPILFLSATDPCAPPGVPALVESPFPPPVVMRAVHRQVKRHTRHWFGEVARLRRDLGLPPGEHPLFEAPFTGEATLALWSRTLGAPQPDWPEGTVLTGFAFHDRLGSGHDTLPSALEAFLSDGEPPICFTLGTSAVLDPGGFWDAAATATTRLGRRAILLTGVHGNAFRPDPTARHLLAVPYAPHSAVMPRCAAVVHQGGVGTTGQALRAGRPQVVVPWSHDQPDHARRIVRAGIGVHLPRHRVDPARLETVLRRVLADAGMAQRARGVAEIVRSEDALGAVVGHPFLKG